MNLMEKVQRMGTTMTRLTPRKLPKQARAKAVVECILQATAKLITTEGVSSLNTNRVAEVAGVSVGSLYQYFPNKKALLAGLYVRLRQELSEVLVPHILQFTDRPAREGAEALLDALIEFYSTDLMLHRELLFRALAAGAERKANESDARVIGALQKWLHTHGAVDSSLEAARVLWSAVSGPLERYVAYSSQDTDFTVARSTLVHVALSLFPNQSIAKQ